MPPPIAFGRYELFERIAVGGMAELYLARMRGEAGFEKVCAVKRVLPHLTDSADFLRMFLDEARLAARLQHPGIAQIFDLGREGDDYFIAMEYLPGEDLASILRQARQTDRAVPVEVAAKIIASAAEALHFAHTFEDDGAPLRIVHRDVSPSNLFVTFQGTVKVLDFGIARAETMNRHTKPGEVRGKIAYMAPEQVREQEVDCRADIWALGACLYELLTGHRPFSQTGTAALVDAVLYAPIVRPSDRTPGLPAELDDIVMAALSRDPAARPPTAEALRDALEAFLAARTYVPHSVLLSGFMRDLYGPEHVARRVRLARGALQERPAVPATGTLSPADAAPATTTQPTTSPERVGTRRPGVRTRIGVAVTLVVLLFGAGVFAFRPRSATTLSPTTASGDAADAALRYRAVVESHPAGAQVYLDGAARPEKTPATLEGLTAGVHELELRADAHVPRKVRFELTEGTPSTSLVIQLEPAPPAAAPSAKPTLARADRPAPASPDGAAESALLTITSNVPVSATLDGVKIGTAPVKAVRVKPGRRRLRLHNAVMGITRQAHVVLRPGRETLYEADFRKGRVDVSVRPWADVWIDGVQYGQTPLAGLELWEGNHKVRLVGPAGEKRLQIQVRAGETTVVRESLP